MPVTTSPASLHSTAGGWELQDFSECQGRLVGCGQWGGSEQSCPWAMLGLWQLSTWGRGVRGYPGCQDRRLARRVCGRCFSEPPGKVSDAIGSSRGLLCCSSQGQCCSKEDELSSRWMGLAGGSQPPSSRDRKSQPPSVLAGKGAPLGHPRSPSVDRARP